MVTRVGDPILAPFTACDYRPDAFAFLVADRYAILLLAIAQAVYRDTAVAKTVFTIIVLVGALVLLAFVRPYGASARWKFGVRIAALSVSVLAAVLNSLAALRPSRVCSICISGSGRNGLRAGNSRACDFVCVGLSSNVAGGAADGADRRTATAPIIAGAGRGAIACRQSNDCSGAFRPP